MLLDVSKRRIKAPGSCRDLVASSPTLLKTKAQKPRVAIVRAVGSQPKLWCASKDLTRRVGAVVLCALMHLPLHRLRPQEYIHRVAAARSRLDLENATLFLLYFVKAWAPPAPCAGGSLCSSNSFFFRSARMLCCKYFLTDAVKKLGRASSCASSSLILVVVLFKSARRLCALSPMLVALPAEIKHC